MRFRIKASPEAIATAIRETALPLDSFSDWGSGPIWPSRFHLNRMNEIGREIPGSGVALVGKESSNSAIGKPGRTEMVSGFYCSAVLVAVPQDHEAYVELEARRSRFGGSVLESEYQLVGRVGRNGTGDHAGWVGHLAIRSAMKPWVEGIAKRAKELDKAGVVPQQTGLTLLVDPDGKIVGVPPEL